MTRSKLRTTTTALAAVAAVAVVAATSATGVAAAAPRTVGTPTIINLTGGTSAMTVAGHPFGSGPGMATGAECDGYADAANALEAQQAENNDQIDGGEHPDNADLEKLRGGILDAGVARGCVFMQL